MVILDCSSVHKEVAMKRILFVLSLAALSAGCADGPLRFFDTATSGADYCGSAATYAKDVFASDYRDRRGLEERDVRIAVESEARGMETDVRKTYPPPEKMESAFKVIRKEKKAKLETVRIAYANPHPSPEEVEKEVRESCLNGWGGNVWYSLNGLKR